MKEMKTPKTGRLSRVFSYACAAFLAVQPGASSITTDPDDRTAAEAARLGLDESELRQLSQSPFKVFYPENNTADAVPVPRNAHNDVKETTSHDNFLGKSLQHTFFGIRISGALFPCTVLAPSERLTLQSIKESFTSLYRPEYFPGDARDYQKFFLAHEIAHCDQSRSATNGDVMERDADIAAIDFYLKHDGNPDVVRAVIYSRALNAMTAYITSTPGDGNASAAYDSRAHDSIMGPALHHRYIDGSGPAFSPGDVKAGYIEAAKALKTLAGDDRLSLHNHEDLSALARTALRTDMSLSPAARHILLLHQEAIDFFMKPGDTPKAAPLPMRRPDIS